MGRMTVSLGTGPDGSSSTVVQKAWRQLFAVVSVIAMLCVGGMAFAEEPDARLEKIEQALKEMKQRVDEALDRRVREPATGQGSMENAGSGQTIDELSERVDFAEEMLNDLDEKVGSRAIVHAFDAMEFDLGGFVHTAFTHVNGDSGSASSFDRMTLELLGKIKFTEDISAFFAQAFIRESNLRFTDTFRRKNPGMVFSGGGGVKTPLVIAWVNYKYNDAANLRVGRYITPFGITNIEHFPAILLDPEQPQFLRPFSGDTIFPNFLTGAQAHGRFFFGDNTLQYYGYTGIFTGSTPNRFYSGGRLAYTVGEVGTTVGINGGWGKRSIVTNAPDTTVVSGNATFGMFGIDLLVDKGPILWKTELFFTDEASGAGGNRTAFYTQPAYRITDKWIAFYRYDFLNDGSLLVSSAGGGPRNNTPGNSTEHVFGVNFLPASNVRLRATFTLKDFSSGRLGAPDTQAQIFQLSGTFSF